MFRSITKEKFQIQQTCMISTNLVDFSTKTTSLASSPFRSLNTQFHSFIGTGKLYNKPWQKTTKKFKKVSVCCFKGDDTNHYHIILATPPPQWEVQE